MPKGTKGKGEKKPGAWVIRDIPRDLMRRVKIAAAIQGTSVKQLLLDLAEEHLKDLEKRGIMPRGQ